MNEAHLNQLCVLFYLLHFSQTKKKRFIYDRDFPPLFAMYIVRHDTCVASQEHACRIVHMHPHNIFIYFPLKQLEVLPKQKCAAHLKMCKYILNIHSTTTSVAVLGELGRRPMFVHNLVKMVKYWCKLTVMNTSRYNTLDHVIKCCINSIMLEK
jgi:hypothetical protein